MEVASWFKLNDGKDWKISWLDENVEINEENEDIGCFCIYLRITNTWILRKIAEERDRKKNNLKWMQARIESKQTVTLM